MREITDYTEWLTLPVERLEFLLADTLRELSLIEQEIAYAESEKIKGRVNAYKDSDKTSATARAQDAEIATVTLAATLVELHSDKTSLLEEKFFILRLLDSRKDAGD